VPPSVRCVLVHPHMMLSTREARNILNRSIDLSNVIWQSANLAGFLTGCFTGDLQLIRDSLEDVVIEPQRKVLIPGFQAVKDGAMGNGAMGCSISGAGPTIFAWCEEPDAARILDAMVAGFTANGLQSDAWISTLDRVGAQIVD
jgi:homoserine kinase